MFGASSASNRAARCILLGLAVVSTLVVTMDTADARRRHRHRGHHVERSTYNPPFSSIIVDANSGSVLQATSADGIRHPASLTKIMTLYLLFERLETGKLQLDSTLDVSTHASVQSPTKLGLRPGQTIRVEDAIKGIVTRSANDAAVVVAEAIGGSEENFAKLMTRKARALGMSKTVYVNASGLPDDEQITTARDQSILGRAIQDRFPRYYRYFATEAFNFRGRVIRNHNRLLGKVEGVDGIKTGYVRASGFNLVTSMRRGNRHLVGVVMGGRSGPTRDAIMRNLLAEHLDEGATRRTVAAITERNTDSRIAEADDDALDQNRSRAATPAAQVQGAIQTASAAPDPVPVPAPRAAPSAPIKLAPEAQGEPKPAPAPLTSGVISSPIATTPGSTEPMTPVRVKTVQVRMNGTKVASAAAPKPLAPIATSAIPPRAPEPAEKSRAAQMRAAETPRGVSTQPAFPAPLPIVISHTSAGIGQGSVGTVPATDPSRGAPPTTLGAQAHALQTQPAPPQPQQQVAMASAAPAETVPHAAPAKARSGWIIQVGALESESEARQRLDAARGSARKLLGHADPFTEAVSKGHKTFYRARFAGLDQNSAEAACRTLKRSDISCITIRN